MPHLQLTHEMELMGKLPGPGMPGPYFLCSGKLSETLPCYTGLNERGKTRCFRF